MQIVVRPGSLSWSFVFWGFDVMQYVFGTLVPQHFLPALGFIAVRQTQMDKAVNQSIGDLTGLDHSSLIALLSPVMNLSTRVEMLERLIPLKIEDIVDRCKLVAIAREVRDLNSLRNRLIHDLPYAYSPSEDSLMFVRSETWTDPQVKASLPKHVTPEGLYELGNRMLQAEIWLGMRFQSSGVGLEAHPDWLDRTKFPWPDKFEQLLRNLKTEQP
ncbi:hypothetical protein FJ417_23530 [Mesorhizobium sp. B3-1-7]|uniref:hypothetical protein n=1 Tax=Mesorhizobium sp. B3-1-7 TaxID=2589894 RepID=UPI001127B6E6|nr:hypothetical protein [Mesorhizobium sp. B3-1-7]TPI55857.1 hypothetical protein FJ417_23530 [Mesorhizobium sp. B3-1-7]